MGPDGKWLAPPHRGDEAVLYADLDLGIIAFAKYFADAAGHYSRPDVFSFGINRTPQVPLAGQHVGVVQQFPVSAAELGGTAGTEPPAGILVALDD
jgi:aliphatic nitrilase